MAASTAHYRVLRPPVTFKPVRIAIASLFIVAAWVLLALQVEPVPTWFYVFAWYPTLVLLDAVAIRRGERSLFRQPSLIASVFGWSVAVWLVFEAANLRLENWYYVFLPRAPVERWAGIILSFATVVPAIVLAERVLASLGAGERWRTRPMPLGLSRADRFVGVGLALLGLTLWRPTWFYPLVWGAVVLIADPIVYRRRPDLSLLAGVERGDWRRIGRLLLGGLVIGGLWETYNYWARGRWVYTVPLLEDLKWFEMPPLGFVGFPFFALEAWAMYSLLVVWGVAVPLLTDDDGRRQAMMGDAGQGAARKDEEGRGETVGDERGRSQAIEGDRRQRRVVVVAAAAAFSVATLLGMERYTISSTVPSLGIRPAALEPISSAWQLARLSADSLAAATGLPADSARGLVELARLATLRGIGTGHATALARINVRTVCALADRDAEQLWGHLHALNPELGRRPTPAEVRVWTRAARRACPL